MNAIRLQITIEGAVQGVGFRPFIYRLATDLGLTGWVNNSAQGIFIEVEGSSFQLETFLRRIKQEKPPRSFIHHFNYSVLDPVGYSDFDIRASVTGEKTAIVLPDIATCSDCLSEILKPSDRRYRYPFTNCTNCGPRFSIIEALPYDRPNTTMRQFAMCRHCQTEYENPSDRRFHAQPNACPQCGPHLELWSRAGQILASHDRALQLTVDAIRQGKIVAVKGLGGFHLIVDAGNETTIERLRLVKHREAKPFALMYSSLDLIKAHCHVSDLEAQLLQSPEAPIVLLKLKAQNSKLKTSSPLAPSVAPNNPYLGIMLPYTPLHHLLLAELGFPVVATSGNRSDEPICTDEQEAIERLQDMADLFLVHDRPIARPVDDSVVRVMAGQEIILRRARGYALLSFPLPRSISPTFAFGAQLKNTIAFSMNQQVFVSQHLGDLNTVLSINAFQQTIAQFQQLYELQPVAVACDLHPDYRSTQFAEELAQRLKIPVIPVQHHYAHTLSCMAEHQLEGTALGIAWDGTGYGLDGAIWGGEFLQITETSFNRVAHFRTFGLPGGEITVKQPRRSAIGLLYELYGEKLFQMHSLASIQAFTDQERQILHTMLKQNVNSPTTSSVGRLFDVVASLTGLRQYAQFEGQAAMELEFAIGTLQTNEYYPLEILELKISETKAPVVIDWTGMILKILVDISNRTPINRISAKFHNTLVEAIVAIAKRVEEQQVILTGGCFQNKYLLERTIQRLRAEGFCPSWHQYIPPNDGGIALGQIIAASRELSGGKSNVFSSSRKNYQYQ